MDNFPIPQQLVNREGRKPDRDDIGIAGLYVILYDIPLVRILYLLFPLFFPLFFPPISNVRPSISKSDIFELITSLMTLV